MRNIQLDWQQAAALTAALSLGRVAVSRSRSRSRGRLVGGLAPYLRESAIVAGLYTVWQFAAAESQLHGAAKSFDRGRTILRLESDVRLPSELDTQHLIDGHRLAEQLCNLYYATMHFFALGVLLVWLFARHRPRYARVRWVIVLLTLSCLLIQLWAVAPPRLLPDRGFTDTAAKLGQSVYQISGVTTDQLSAMPSVHVGWAVLVAWAVITISDSRWRWLIVAHPLITSFVVVATANHYWLDGIVAIVLLILAISVTTLAPWVLRRQDDGRTDATAAASLNAAAAGSP